MGIVNEERLYSSFGEESLLKFFGPARILTSSSTVSNQILNPPEIVSMPFVVDHTRVLPDEVTTAPAQETSTI